MFNLLEKNKFLNIIFGFNDLQNKFSAAIGNDAKIKQQR